MDIFERVMTHEYSVFDSESHYFDYKSHPIIFHSPDFVTFYEDTSKSKFPIIIMNFHDQDPLNQQQYEGFKAAYFQLYEMYEHFSILFLFFESACTMTSSYYSDMIGALKRFREAKGIEQTVCSSVVIEGPVMRTIFNMFLTFYKPSKPHLAASSLEESYDFIIENDMQVWKGL